MDIDIFQSNVAPKKKLKPAPQPWHCPNCQTTVSAHWSQCPICLKPRTNSYDPVLD